MEAGMKVVLPLTMNNPIKMTNDSMSDQKNQTLTPHFRQIATEGLRLSISPGISPHMAKLIKICMNEVIHTMIFGVSKYEETVFQDPGKRPTFDVLIPILEKMKK